MESGIDGYTPKEHPVLKKPDVKLLVEKVGLEKAIEVLQLREDKILAEQLDPYRHGYEPEHWGWSDQLLKEKQEILVLGGNRAGKTEWAAKRVIQTLINKDKAMVWCLHTTHQSSIQMQQTVLWKYLPPELKSAKKTRITNVSYTQKNGFSENSFVLPNGSQCVFMNYAQKKEVIEGGECDLIWCDELVPLDWVETLRYRIVTRRGKLAITFTPVLGYSQVVKDYVAGCRFKKEMRAGLLDEKAIHVNGCKRGNMPVIGECIRNNAGVVWFHSIFNPYNPFDELQKTLKGRNNHEIKIRAYGWADNMVGSQFPKFNEDVHVIKESAVPVEGTNYMTIDPAGARNWFMVWCRVTPDGDYVVYREYPDMSLGEWALPSEHPDGKEGIAQRNGAGMGLDSYKSVITELEGDEIIAERWIDPRAGATQTIGREGGTSLIELLADGDMPMYFTPAAGLPIEQGVTVVNDLLDYDYGEPISTINKPKLYISENCKNLIYCVKEWTGSDKEKGATKDPVDCLRYMMIMQPVYFDPKAKLETDTYTY